MLREPVAEPMAWNAALEGAKMVTSLRSSTAEMRDVAMRAPARAVRLESMALKEGMSGTVITVSIICNTPPVNMISCYHTISAHTSNPTIPRDGKARGTHSSNNSSLLL